MEKGKKIPTECVILFHLLVKVYIELEKFEPALRKEGIEKIKIS